MPLMYLTHVSRATLRAYPDTLFLFGDNEARVGFGGQARECRGEPNAIGVATKRLPSRSPTAYWSDDDYERCVACIDKDLDPAFKHAMKGGMIACPLSGLGTGLADLPNRAPRVFAYLKKRISELAEIRP